jgi:ABC-type multidrug transport system fused ATPase/permease subunit
VDLFKHATEYNGDQETSNDSTLFSLINTQLMTTSLFVFLNLTKNKEDALSEFMRFEDDVKIEQLNRIGFSVGLIICFVTAFYLRSATNWMNLRTATRLRSGILASVYRRAMKSSVNYNVSANQILTVANEESNVIFNVIENGALVVGTLFGVVCSLAAAFVLLNVTGFWPSIVMAVELALLVVLAIVASYYLRQGMTSSGEKLSVVEEVCINFKSIVVMGLEKIYLDRFFKASVNHHTMIRKAVVWSSASFIGGITSAVLLTGLYVNWCFVETDGISVLILIIVFAYFLKSLVLEFGQSVQSIAMGMSTLNNLLKYYMMVKPKAFKSFPPAPYVAKITEDAAFKWPDDKSLFQLNVDSFSLIKGQVVGLTGPSGSGKTTFLYSLLGHTQLIRGLVRLNVKMAFFPKIPVIIVGSLKDNILMGADYDPKRYFDAICAVKLNKDVFVTTDTDEMPIGGLELDREQLERVVLARAAYSDSEVFLFDDPLASVKNTKEAVIYLKNVLEIMAITKKTVLMATQNGEVGCEVLVKSAKLTFSCSSSWPSVALSICWTVER